MESAVTASDTNDHEASSDIFMWYPMVSEANMVHRVDETVVSRRTEMEAPSGVEVVDGSRRTDLDTDDWGCTDWKWIVWMVRCRMKKYRHDVDMSSLLWSERHTWPKTEVLTLSVCKITGHLSKNKVSGGTHLVGSPHCGRRLRSLPEPLLFPRSVPLEFRNRRDVYPH